MKTIKSISLMLVLTMIMSIIPVSASAATGCPHTRKQTETIEVTLNENGDTTTLEYYVCKRCGEKFATSAMTTPFDDDYIASYVADVNRMNSTNKHYVHEHVDPTCKTDGYDIEYWVFDDTDVKYTDETLATELSATSLEKLKNKNRIFAYGCIDEDHDQVCDDCGKLVPMYKKVTSPSDITENGKYIITAEYNGKTYVITDDIYNQTTNDGNYIGFFGTNIATSGDYIYFEDANDINAEMFTFVKAHTDSDTNTTWYYAATQDENNKVKTLSKYAVPNNVLGMADDYSDSMSFIVNKNDASVDITWNNDFVDPVNTYAITETYLYDRKPTVSFVTKRPDDSLQSFLSERSGTIMLNLSTNENWTSYVWNSSTDADTGMIVNYDYNLVPIYLYKLTEGGSFRNIRYAYGTKKPATEINYEVITDLVEVDIEKAMFLNNVSGVSEALSQEAIEQYVELLAGDSEDITLNVSADLTVSDFKRDSMVTFTVDPYIYNIADPDNKVPIDDSNFTGAPMPVTLYTAGITPKQVIHEKRDGTKEYFYPNTEANVKLGKKTFAYTKLDNGEYYVTVNLTEFSDIVICAEEQEEEIEATTEPTTEPIEKPTVEPTAKPTAEPTVVPTEEPTTAPTEAPTPEPTETPVYKITWYDDANNIIDVTEIKYGETPSHEPLVKENTAEFTYAFTRWMPALQPATSDRSYRPVFRSTTNKYNVTKADTENGTFTLSAEGETPYGTEITIVPTANDGYEIDKVYTITDNKTEIETVNGEYKYTVTGDVTIEVTFKVLPPIEYTVRFENNGYGVKPENVTEIVGTTINLNDYVLTDNDYNFEGWYTDVDYLNEVTDDYEITSDITLYAKWTIKIYTITWLNGDEKIKDTAVESNNAIIYDGETPIKAEDDAYTYIFKGWALTEGGEILNEIPAADSDTKYYAVFEAVKKAPAEYEFTVLDAYADKLTLKATNTGTQTVMLTAEATEGNVLPAKLHGYIAIYENNVLAGITEIKFINGDADVTIPETDYKLFIWDDITPATNTVTTLFD